MPNIPIPKEIILDTHLGTKRAIHYAAVYLSENKAEYTVISNDFITYLCGYKVNRHPERASQQFKDLTSHLVSDGYLSFVQGEGGSLDKTVSVLTPKAMYPDHFALVSQNEFCRIVNYSSTLGRKRSSKLTQAEVFLLLATIRLWIGANPETKHSCCFFLLTLSSQSGLPVSTIRNGLEILEELEIIHTEPLPNPTCMNDDYKTSKRIFINMTDAKEVDYDWHQELEQAKIYYQQNKTNR